MKRIVAVFMIFSSALSVSLLDSIKVYASENRVSMMTEDTNISTNFEEITPYAILQVAGTAKTPSGWVTVGYSFGYHDYYGTIAGINYVNVPYFISSKINGSPSLSYYNAGTYIVVTVTYVRLSDFNYVSETITIYP
jgi:hypothetical protein